jgi:hypothetical protein
MRRLVEWLKGPWSEADRQAETDDLNALRGELALRGATNTQGAKRDERRLVARYAQRRLALRLMVVAVAIIAAAAVAEQYTSNRLPKAIVAAVTACAVPVALYLGVRQRAGSS